MKNKGVVIMLQRVRKNTKQQKGIMAEELALEIKEAIKDCFVAQVAQNGVQIVLRFTSGQTFSLRIEESEAS